MSFCDQGFWTPPLAPNSFLSKEADWPSHHLFAGILKSIENPSTLWVCFEAFLWLPRISTRAPKHFFFFSFHSTHFLYSQLNDFCFNYYFQLKTKTFLPPQQCCCVFSNIQHPAPIFCCFPQHTFKHGSVNVAVRTQRVHFFALR